MTGTDCHCDRLKTQDTWDLESDQLLRDTDKYVSITGATATYDPDTSKNVSPYDDRITPDSWLTSGVWSTKSDLEHDRPYGRQNAVKRPPNSKKRNLL